MSKRKRNKTSTAMPVLATDSTEYTDSQFYADLAKASEALNRMVREAVLEDEQGKPKRKC